MKIAIIPVLSLIYVAFTHAATVIVTNVQNGIGDTIYAKSDGTLTSGGIVTLGYFPALYNVNANVGNVAGLIANFTVLTSALTDTPSPSLGGAFDGFVEQSAATSIGTITGADPLIGRGLYSFVGDQNTLSASGEVALLFIQNIGDDSPFEFNYSSNPTGVVPTIGNIGTFTGNASGIAASVHPTVVLVAIPEPSSLLLGALGILGLLRRKR